MARNFATMTAILLACATAETARADLVINIKPGTGNSVLMEITGSGTVGSVYGSGNGLTIGTPAVSFLGNLTAFVNDYDPDPVFTLGDAEGSFASYGDYSPFTFNDGAVHGSALRILFDTQPGVEVGDELSDLSGTYALDDWSYSDFLVGSYSLDSFGDTSNFFNGVGDVGSITLNVVAIPEAGSFLCLGLISLGFLGRRPKQTHSAPT